MERYIKYILIVFLFSHFVIGCYETSVIITGKTTDSEGSPIPGTSIVVDSNLSDDRYTCTADENGSFRMENIPSGDYSLEATSGSYHGFTGVSLEDNIFISCQPTREEKVDILLYIENENFSYSVNTDTDTYQIGETVTIYPKITNDNECKAKHGYTLDLDNLFGCSVWKDDQYIWPESYPTILPYFYETFDPKETKSRTYYWIASTSGTCTVVFKSTSTDIEIQ